MYVISGASRCIIIAPEFTIQIAYRFVVMMVERIYTGQFAGLIIPMPELKLRQRSYHITSPKCSATISSNTVVQYVRDSVCEYTTWKIPDFAKQCEVMNLLCKLIY